MDPCAQILQEFTSMNWNEHFIRESQGFLYINTNQIREPEHKSKYKYCHNIMAHPEFFRCYRTYIKLIKAGQNWKHNNITELTDLLYIHLFFLKCLEKYKYNYNYRTSNNKYNKKNKKYRI